MRYTEKRNDEKRNDEKRNYKKRSYGKMYRRRSGYKNRRIDRKKELLIKISGTVLTFALVTSVAGYYIGKEKSKSLVHAEDSLPEQIHGEMEINIPVHENGTEQNPEQNTEQTELPEQKFQYPAFDAAYADIVSEEVKSPYIALLDVESNKVIAGRNADAKIYPASMTKVLTLIVVVEHLTDLSQTFTMTGDIVDPLVREQASRAGFEAGDTVSAEDMLYGLILPSGADAAVGLAILTAGSEAAFVELMNQKCAELGLVSSHFTNASGLFNENQYTTPVEMSLILKYAMQNETCAKILSTYQYTTAPTASNPLGILLTSTMFSRMYGTEVEGVAITAGKTGYTDEAKNCLVSFAEKSGHHYIALTAGAENRWHAIFDDFEIYRNYLP